MKIKEIVDRFKNEWVLTEVTKIDNNGNPIEGNVLAHSKNRDETYEAMKRSKAKDVAHFYTGEIPQKGYAVAFDGKTKLRQ